ncbi:hypothetical protein P618_200287 [Holospora obtusa F1]|uniref:Uncharacterized protein n=1 Tax=Holospora obtusa F1 TaxID=1399147 RepID=W6TF09_HOLOB|nr:hypothetical protein [Holospora obtusa]ETZ07526.1 hypothetical protein P618_200287 [Holospora obtusa F1]
MTKAEIYQEIRNISPTWSGEAQELVENLEEFENDELLQDLDDVYQEWSKKENDDSIQQCVSLFDVILQAIFNHGDSSVIPHLLKYVPSDDYYEDAVVMEDYSSEPLCNGIVDSDYFGESYIPVLLGCIHELVPRAMVHVKWFLYSMILDDLGKFQNTRPLMNNLRVAEKKSFINILNYSIEKSLEELQERSVERKENAMKRLKEPINSVIYDDEGIVQFTFVRKEFLKLYADV